MRRPLLSIFLAPALWLALLLAPGVPAAELERPEATSYLRLDRAAPLCIDAVVVARVVRYRDPPRPDDPTASRHPSELDVFVDRVYLGDPEEGPLTIEASLNAPYKYEAPLVFMLTRQQKTWHVVHATYAVLDTLKRFVIPMYAPARDIDLVPQGWMPHDYQQWLRPIHYPALQEVPGTAHWKQGPEYWDDEWARVSRYRVTVKRGFWLADVPDMLKERRAMECRRLN